METNDEIKEKPLPRYKQLKLEIEQRKKARKKKLIQKKDTIYRRKLRARRKKEKIAAEKKAIRDEKQRIRLENKHSWRIFILSQKKLRVEVKYFNDKDTAIKAFHKMLEDNKAQVRFPVKYTSRDHLMFEADYELLLMRKRKEHEPEFSLLRNEIGVFAPHKTNSDEWLIHDKAPYQFEESFWVLGYDNRTDRKDFNFILNNILLYNLPNVKYHVKRLIVFKNKLIIEDEDDFEMVICKNINDCVRLYNELEKEILKLKIKSAFFAGFASETVSRRIFERIKEKTGWNYKKIMRDSTRP